MCKGLSHITAVVLAGGLGTRLRSVVGERPKVLAEVAGRPFLAYLLDQLAAAGVRRAVLCTGYQAERVRTTFGESYRELAIEHSAETTPMGTGGALRMALPRVESSTVLVANGDSWCQADLPAFLNRHRQTGALGSLLLTHVPDASRYGSVGADASGRITRFEEKKPEASPGWINAGIYLFERELLAAIPPKETISLERQVFPAWIGRGLFGFKLGGRFVDIGTPESLAEAERFFGRDGWDLATSQFNLIHHRASPMGSG
jgi:NDP-sugar pyrophosphorylase family protein